MIDVTKTLSEIVGPSNVRCGDQVRAVDYGILSENLAANIMVSPSSTEQIQDVVRLCASQGIAIVPQGGRTGLVGGGVSKPGDVIIATSRMNKIEKIDAVERTAVVQAGTTLQALRDAAARYNLEPGIDLPSRGSATIGGMCSTNAGGLSALRNGVMRHQVLGLEAVLPNGDRYCDMTRVVKNAAGYDLKHLLIGAEGTLGIITRAVIKLETVPQATATVLIGFASVSDALETLNDARNIGASLRAAEAMWSHFFRQTSSVLGWSFPDGDLGNVVYLLLSLAGDSEAVLQERLFEIYERAEERRGGRPAVVASSSQQEAELWRLREDTETIYRLFPGAPSFDVSVPLSELQRYVDTRIMSLASSPLGLQPFVFGHIGDGNLHIILDRRAGDLSVEELQAVETVLYDGLTEIGGSFSAEHGVGSKRMASLLATANTTKLWLMTLVKQALDPQRIMNPGKVIR